MDRRELEGAAARSTYLRGLLWLPLGLLFLLTGVGNLGWDPLGNPFVFLACLGVIAGMWFAGSRYYNDRYGRVRLSKEQQTRFSAVGLVCFGGSMIGGTVLDSTTDLPVSLFAVLFGTGMLVWYLLSVGLRRDHFVVWGALIVAGLLPVWGGFDDRATVGWFPVAVATVIAGVLDHRTLVRTFGPPADVHVGV